MKIKFYIITYNRKNELDKTLKSLFDTDINNYNVQINIVNNYSKIEIDEKWKDKICILNNTFRPDFSTGHLSRNYNEIFLHGFKNLKNPDCDILIHSHDDNFFQKNLFEKLIEYHKNYTFITFSWGCGFCSYLPEAIKKIGIWDERFCTIGYHEGDYFLRALKYNNKFSSINDWEAAKRIHNPIKENPLAYKQPETKNHNEAHKNSWNYYSICRRLWEKKWPNWKNADNRICDTYWQNVSEKNIPLPSIETYMLYPYFEKDIENIEEKYYPDIELNGNPFF